MAKVTLEVLAEKIDNLCERLDTIATAEQSNTEFRLQAKGIIGAATLVSGLVGGFIMFAVGKIWK